MPSKKAMARAGPPTRAAATNPMKRSLIVAAPLALPFERAALSLGLEPALPFRGRHPGRPAGLARAQAAPEQRHEAFGHRFAIAELTPAPGLHQPQPPLAI